jgi:ABC-type multidrug transport system fused ATPase/permease subunit
MIISSVAGLSFILMMFPMLSTSAKRINEVLDMPPEKLSGEKPEKKLSGRIEFSSACFTFDPSATEPVLRNIHMIFEPGKTVAILGGTGSGKSTIAKLLLKLYPLTSGSLCFDGIDSSLLSAEYIRAGIAYIPQFSVIFMGTLKSNILLGNLYASKEEIQTAIETAQMSEFVSVKQEGLDYVVSEGGKNLSGGQRQRLSIARALVRDANIIVFDDSFSALDYATDLKLRTALNEKYKEKTKIIITQRVATALNADTIYVLENGMVTASGNHDSLLKKSNTYKNLAKLQMNIDEKGAAE